MSDFNTTPDFGGIKLVRASGGTASNRTAPSAPAAQASATAVAAEPSAPRKSRRVRYLVLLMVAALGISAAAWGRSYYDHRYVGADYWAQISASQDTTPIEFLTNHGEPAGDYGVRYEVVAFNEAGEQRALDWEHQGTTPDQLPQPGDFVKLSASAELVRDQQVVAESEIPTDVLKLIREH